MIASTCVSVSSFILLRTDITVQSILYQLLRFTIMEPRRPYADWVERTHGEKQSWLVRFLRRGYATRYWEPRDPYIDIYILDTVEGVVHSQNFRPYRSGEVDSAFVTALAIRRANSKTRLVMVQGSQLGDTNAAYLDAIGWQYQIDPHFFCTHLQDALYLTEGRQIVGPVRLPVWLPTENDCMTAVTDSNSYANIIILKNDGLTTSMYHVVHPH
jgi:hypothetical protein